MDFTYQNRLRSSSASSASSASSSCSTQSSTSSISSSSDVQDCNIHSNTMLTSWSPQQHPPPNGSNTGTHHHHNHHHHHQHPFNGNNKITKTISPSNHRITRSRSSQQQYQEDMMMHENNDKKTKTLTRSTGLLNLDEASLGSPGTKKSMIFSPTNSNNNLQHGVGLKRPLSGQGRATNDNSSNSEGGDKNKFTFPKPKPVFQVQQHVLSPGHITNSPSFNSKLRKTNSVDNLFSHQQQKKPQQQSSDEGQNYLSSPTNNNNEHQFNNKHTNDPSKPKFKFNASLQVEQQQDYNTPDNNYKSVKPLQTAFMSTGLMSKRNRMNSFNHPGSIGSNRSGLSGNDSRGPPETPCKKANNSSTPSNKSSLLSNFQQNQSYPFSTNTPSQTSGSESSVRSKFGLRDSKLRFSIDFGNTSADFANVNNNKHNYDYDYDYDDAMIDDESSLPATPTKDNSSNSIYHHHNNNNPFEAMPVATKQISESSACTVTMATRNNNTAKMPPTSSPAHSSLPFFPSPNTPDFLNNSNNEHNHEMNNNSNTTYSDSPRTPAKSPKTPLDNTSFDFNSYYGEVSFDSQKADDSFEPVLVERFDKVSLIGRGEFSMVYSVSQKPATPGIEAHKYAVKRTKDPYLGPKARNRLLEEVDILKELSSKKDNEGYDHVIELADAFEQQGHLYITTEFCENGNLDTFVSEQGNISRLDEWRVWKILVELSMGLHHIHSHDFLHLDLKPANVFITFEGTLKIGDFGMATRYPTPKGIEREGDREYIAPEVLSCQQYDKPADVFSLGLMMLEIAANIVLPDNGVHWQKLRSGDLTEAGKLSSGDLRAHDDEEDEDEDHAMCSPIRKPPSHNLHRRSSSNIPEWAPKFMTDNSGALDRIVKWMLDPEPTKRPTAQEILMTPEVAWVEKHRKAGAVIYEGDYGPEPDSFLNQGNDDDDDEEMHMDDAGDGDDEWRR